MVRFSNLEILKILRSNARTPFLQIARQFGVSEAAVRKRVKKLEEEGVIRRYTIDVDFRKLGYEVHTFIGIDVKPESLVSTMRRLEELEEVFNLYLTSGDHVLIAECWLKDRTELVNFLIKLNSIDGVTRVCPSIVIEKIK